MKTIMTSLSETTRRHAGRALLVTALAVLPACSPGGQQATAQPAAAPASRVNPPSPAEQAALTLLYQETLKAGESETVIYISSVAEEVQPLATAFAQAYPGVRANFQRLMGDKLLARLDGEFNSGKRAGDIVIGGAIAQTLESMPRDRWLAFAPPTAAALAGRYRDADNFYHIAYKKSFAIAYNPTLISKDEVPRTIAQVLEPRWKGRYSHPTFGAFSTSDTALMRMHNSGQLSDAQLRDFIDNGLAAPPSSELVPWIAQGRLLFSVWVNAAAVLPQQAQGANVALSFSPSIDLLGETGIGILRQPPHPHASRLFKAWMFTPQAQAILADLKFYGVMPGAPAPTGLPGADQHLNSGAVDDQPTLDALRQFRKGPLAAILKKP